MKNLWIKPNGQVLDIGPQSHNQFAREFLLQELGREDLRRVKEEEDARSYSALLHLKGWVRVSIHSGKVDVLGNCISLVRPMRNTMDPPMNPAQMKSAKRICGEYGADFHNAINDSRFWNR